MIEYERPGGYPAAGEDSPRGRGRRTGITLGTRARKSLCTGVPLVFFALAGCTTTRYSRIYCLTPGQLQTLKDAEPERVGNRLTGQAQTDIKIVAGSAVELRRYSGDLLGVLSGCTGE